MGVDPVISDKVFERLQKAGFYGVSPQERPESLLFAQYLVQTGNDIFTLKMSELGELYKEFTGTHDR